MDTNDAYFKLKQKKEIINDMIEEKRIIKNEISYIVVHMCLILMANTFAFCVLCMLFESDNIYIENAMSLDIVFKYTSIVIFILAIFISITYMIHYIKETFSHISDIIKINKRLKNG